MKNTRMIFTALAVALTLGTVPMQAKNAAMDNLNKKVKELGNCLRGKQKCTLRQKLGIAAAIGAAAILVAKGIGMGLEKGGRAMQRQGQYETRDLVGGGIQIVGEQLQRPADVIGRGAVATAAGARRGVLATGKYASGKIEQAREARMRRKAMSTPLPESSDEDL